MGWEWYRKLYGGLLYLFSPVSSVDVKAWMFANTTKSSSVWNSSRQLYRLNKTVFTVNWLNTFWSLTTSTSIVNKLLYFSNDIFLILHMEIHLNSSWFCSFAMRWCQWLPRLCISISCLRAEESSARTTEPETNDTKLEVYAVLSFLLYFKTSHTSQRCYDLLRLLFILETTNFNAVSVTCVNPHWFNSSVTFNKKNVRFL